MSRCLRRRGAALVLVLIVTLLLGLVAAALAFTVTLDGLAARNVQEAALAEGSAEGALQLAAKWAAEAAGDTLATGVSPVPPELGGLEASVSVSAGPEGIVLSSLATVGRSTARRTLTVLYDAAGLPAIAARP